MSIDGQFFLLITPIAVATAIASGIAFALVVHGLRSAAEPRLITYLVTVLAVCWYMPQMLQLLITEGGGWGTLGRLALFLVGFVVPMHLTLLWKQRR